MQSKSIGRRIDIEAIRILSAFGIVAFHTATLTSIPNSIAYSGLIFFILITITFSCNRPLNPQKTLEKIIIPYILWCGLYLIVGYVFKGKGDYLNSLNLSNIFSGTSIHLWYLPFILIASLTISRLKVSKSWSYGLVIALPLAVISAPYTKDYMTELGTPLPQYLHALPAILLGLALYIEITTPNLINKVALGLFSFASIVNIYQSYYGDGATYLVAFAFGLIFLSKNSLLKAKALEKPIFSLSSKTYTVYLIHPLAISICNRLFDPSPLTTIPAAIAISIIAAYSMLLIPKPIRKYISPN